MGRRPKTNPARDAQTRRATTDAKDAQNEALKIAGHDEPETADEAQTEADVPQDEANVAETAQPLAETAVDAVSTGIEAGGEGAEAADTAGETNAAGNAAEPADGQTSQPDTETATTSEVPVSATTLETGDALALRRFAEAPKCACGCGMALPNPKRCFLIGHDGKLKSVLKRVLRKELPPEAIPTEAIIRHREIRFLMTDPLYQSLVESWAKAK